MLTAFLLGLLTAISPCPLATNITAVGYIGRDITNPRRIFRNGVLYTLGRMIAYAGIGIVLIPLLREGASLFAFQRVLGRYGDLVLAPVLIAVGMFLLFGDRLNLPKFGFSGSGESVGRGGWGALLLGVLFALAFCPTSGVFYFGMLLPLSAAETGGYWLPAVFAIATGLPVVVVAWLLAYGVAGVGRFYRCMQVLQRWMNRIIAGLFIAVGFYYLMNYFL